LANADQTDDDTDGLGYYAFHGLTRWHVYG